MPARTLQLSVGNIHDWENRNLGQFSRKKTQPLVVDDFDPEDSQLGCFICLIVQASLHPRRSCGLLSEMDSLFDREDGDDLVDWEQSDTEMQDAEAQAAWSDLDNVTEGTSATDESVELGETDRMDTREAAGRVACVRGKVSCPLCGKHFFSHEVQWILTGSRSEGSTSGALDHTAGRLKSRGLGSAWKGIAGSKAECC